MTTPTNQPEPMALADIRALLEQTAELSAENARAIAEMRADNVARAARHDREMAEIRARDAERAARHDKEMADIRAAQDRTEKIVSENSAAIAEMRASQERLDRRFERLMEAHRETRGRVSQLRAEHDYTSNDVSTLKGWGMEFLCERRPGHFAEALKLNSIELFPREKMLTMAIDAAQRGIISGSSANDLHSGDVYFYGRREEDDIPVYLIVQASFEVKRGDVKRASAQAETLETILRHDGPPEETGIAVPVVAGTRLRTDPDTGAVMVSLWDVTYVEINNGNELTA